MVAMQSKMPRITMSTPKYISPEISLLDVRVEQGFSASQDSGFDFGTNDWGEGDDYNGDAE